MVVNDCICFDIAESTEFTHFLHQPLLFFLECSFSGRVVSDISKLNLLSSHGILLCPAREWERCI